MNFNKVIVLGNLTRDPEIRTLPSGQPVASFGLATNRFYTDQGGAKQQATEFHNIVVFGKLADVCGRYLNKGKMILIEGRLQTRNWVDQSGIKKYRTEIIAENMQMGPKQQADSETNFNSPNQSTNQTQANAEDIPIIEADEPLSNTDEANNLETNSDDQENIKVENIPF